MVIQCWVTSLILNQHHNQLERLIYKAMMIFKHNRTCPVSQHSPFCGHNSSFWYSLQLWESQTLMQWSVFTKEEGIGPIALFLWESVCCCWSYQKSKGQQEGDLRPLSSLALAGKFVENTGYGGKWVRRWWSDDRGRMGQAGGREVEEEHVVCYEVGQTWRGKSGGWSGGCSSFSWKGESRCISR